MRMQIRTVERQVLTGIYVSYESGRTLDKEIFTINAVGYSIDFIRISLEELDILIEELLELKRFIDKNKIKEQEGEK